jgi:NAD(P)-dependent dehydrogenase (short-subunit alcohol dehydrogenase family)
MQKIADDVACYPSLINKKIVITGAASGIGASMVEYFLAQDTHVVFLDIDKTAAKKLQAQLGNPEKLKFFACDVSDFDLLQQTMQLAVEHLAGVNVLINNVGSDVRHSALTVSEAQWEKIININLRSQFIAAQAVIPGMQKKFGGSIVNISSNCFLLKENSKYPIYATAKSAIVGLTHALAAEFGKNNIRVNAILPGWVMTERQIAECLTPEAEIELLEEQMLKQKIYPADIARVALFLASEESRMITKQCILVDAGRA